MRGRRNGQRDHPRTALRRLLRFLPTLGALIVIGALVAGVAPAGTSAFALTVRVGLASAVGLILVEVVRRSLAALAATPPPSPAAVDARSAEVVYECPVCRTRVRLEAAGTGKSPRHCGEEMEPQVTPGSA